MTQSERYTALKGFLIANDCWDAYEQNRIEHKISDTPNDMTSLLNGTASYTIYGAFTWVVTKEGAAYWLDIATRFSSKFTIV